MPAHCASLGVVIMRHLLNRLRNCCDRLTTECHYCNIIAFFEAFCPVVRHVYFPPKFVRCFDYLVLKNDDDHQQKVNMQHYQRLTMQQPNLPMTGTHLIINANTPSSCSNAKT